jgi:DNA mismatch endonuclease (patch repair protein)
MSKIRSVGTKSEEQLHIALKNMGLRHKMNPKIAGMPDAIIPSKKIAIFVHWCFLALVQIAWAHTKKQLRLLAV